MVDFDRIQADVETEPEQVYRLACRAFLPDALVLLHENEHAADHLVEHRAQIRPGILRVVELRAEEALANSEAFRDRERGHPDIDAVACYVSLPDIALQVPRHQAIRQSEIAANRLPYSQTIQGAGERVDDAVGDGAIILVAMIVGRDEVVAGVEDRAQQQVDPLRRDGAEIGIDHGACLRAQPLRDLEDQPECAAFSRYTVIGER